MLDEQSPEHRQVFSRWGPGCVRAADELHHAPCVGRPPCDMLAGHRDERDLQQPVRVRGFGRWGLDLALFLVFAEGVVQTGKALTVEDDLGVRDPGGPGERVNVPVDVQGKAIDDVTSADRASATRGVVTGIDAPYDLLCPGEPGRVRVLFDLAGRDDDEQVDVTPVVGVAATERSNQPGSTNGWGSLQAFDRPAKPRFADRAQPWSWGNPGISARRVKSLTGAISLGKMY